ncbi:S41 family peptidase [Vicingaceae bacterium]|nr:S41 family peptidase [Vicingaceae bacterium]
MNKTFLAIVFFALYASSGFAQDRVANWIADIDYLADELPKKHINLFHTISRDDFAAGVEKLKVSLDQLDDSRITMQIMKLVASVGDGHTALSPDVKILNFLQLQFDWFKDGLFITATAPGLRQHFGGRITKFGEMQVDKVLKDAAKYLSHDNEYQLKSQVTRTLGFAEALVVLGAWSGVKSGSITYEKGGNTQTVLCSTMPYIEAQKTKWESRKGDQSMYAQKYNFDHWNDWLADSKTLYFKYNRCKNAKAFNKLVNGTAGFVAQNDVQRFVLDLRDNGGGNSVIFYPLYRYLADHPTLSEKGKLFVVIGRRTFSSAVLNAMLMKKTNAIFVGEPTGGKPNHFGEVKIMTLPNSKLRVQYSTKYFTQVLGSDPPAVMPDVTVELTFDDWNEGRDPVLETILKN